MPTWNRLDNKYFLVNNWRIGTRTYVSSLRHKRLVGRLYRFDDHNIPEGLSLVYSVQLRQTQVLIRRSKLMQL
jgi:hypothetical protein